MRQHCYIMGLIVNIMMHHNIITISVLIVFFLINLKEIPKSLKYFFLLFFLRAKQTLIQDFCTCFFKKKKICSQKYFFLYFFYSITSGSVLYSRLRGCMFWPHQSYCVDSLSKSLYPPLSTGSTQEALSQYD